MLLFVTAVSIVLVVSFLCSIFESVLLSLTRPQVELMVQQEKRAGSMLSRFKENMDVPIAAILILNTAAHTIGASVAGASYSNVFDASTLWLFSILFTIAVLLLTEIIPKTLGVAHAQALATPVAHGVQLLTVMLQPLVWISERISRSLRGDQDNPVTSMEEIRLMASLGRNEGVVSARAANMIVGATHLRHLDAHDIMLPREDVKFLSTDMTADEVIDIINETGHSRFPLSPTRDLSDVVGVVLAKEVLYWLLKNDAEQIDWDAFTKEPLIVPASAPVPRLLRTYQNARRHLALVVDEYGTVEGIVTLEDVLEEVVGDIRDESDVPATDIRQMDDGTLRVRGQVDLRQVCDMLGMPWEPESEVSTIGGLISETLEKIPDVGDKIEWRDYEIEVLRADKKRARLVKISKK